MREAFGVDGRVYACAICGVPKNEVLDPSDADLAAWYGQGGDDPKYRRDMKDAGRGGQLR